jgi:hypothetical protein
MGAAIFIAIWNLLSVVAEYTLLLAIYNRYPTLGSKTANESDIPDEGIVENWIHQNYHQRFEKSFCFQTERKIRFPAWSLMVLNLSGKESKTPSFLGKYTSCILQEQLESALLFFI